MNISMICTLQTTFQAERDWKNAYREISKFPSNIYSILYDLKSKKCYIFYSGVCCVQLEYMTNYRLEDTGYFKQEVIDDSHNTFRTDIPWILNRFKTLSKKFVVFCFVFQFFNKGSQLTTHLFWTFEKRKTKQRYDRLFKKQSFKII